MSKSEWLIAPRERNGFRKYKPPMDKNFVKQRPVKLMFPNKVLRDEKILAVRSGISCPMLMIQSNFDVVEERDAQREGENPVCSKIQDQAC